MRRFVLLLLGVACSGTKTPPATPAGAPAAIVSPRATDDDVVVAQVNGRPVWGSCVAAQVAHAHGSKTREAALHECIDFELLAQTADQRGLATDRDVVLATRTALVSQVVAKVYEDGYQSPDDFGVMWKKAEERYSYLYKHGEFRGSTFARVQVDEKAPPEVDARARALAERIAAAVANERGMTSSHFVAIAERAAAGEKFQHQDVPPKTYDGLVKPYGDALYGLTEVGTASGAVRTQWGWDVILYTEDVPAADATHDEIVAKMLPNVKQQYFALWVAKVARDLGVHVETFKDNISRLEDLP